MVKKKRNKEAPSPQAPTPQPSLDPPTTLQGWGARFSELARLQLWHPLHETLGHFYPCPICAGDVQGFRARFEASQDLLVKPVRYADKKAGRLMVLLLWYWTAMHCVRRLEDSSKPVRIPPPIRKGPLLTDETRETLKPLGSSARRVRAHRARERGTVASLKVWSVASPAFTGIIGIKQSKSVRVGVAPPGGITMRIPPPRRQKGGRPASSDKPSRLVPVAAAALLHKWFPRQPSRGQFNYLSWSVITKLLTEFTPEGSSFGFQTPASIRRKVRAYRNKASFRKELGALDSNVIPAILRAFGSF